MTKTDIQQIIDNNPELKNKLYARGFFFTNDKIDDNSYPFYGIWQTKIIKEYTLLVADKQKYYINNDGNITYILIGHAYDPSTLVYNEQDILKQLNETEFLSENFWECFNNITGIFTLIVIVEDSIYVVGDPTCMQTTFYCNKNNHVYVSSHTNCIGDILNLDWDAYVKELADYKLFKLFGNSLPGDLTQFNCVKRLVPNHYVKFEKNNKFEIKRFYLPSRITLTREKVIKKATDILHANQYLISKKWNKPAISLTGGGG